MSEVRGVVLSGTGGTWQLLLGNGERVDAVLRGRMKKTDAPLRADGSRKRGVDYTAEGLKLAVGDDVILEADERGETWGITSIVPRRSVLARREPGGRHGERILAANPDQVVIVFAAANPEPHRRMLDRFLVIADGNGIPPRVVVNKVELVEPGSARERFGDYERAGYDVHYTSVKQQVGLDALRDVLHNRVSVLTGPSGVGKSSLLNAIYPGLNLRVGEISESVNKGRHTTVGASMHPLPDGGFVLDTPGLREVGMWALPPEHLDACFAEFKPFLGECRFGDCTHRREPGCAVLAAVGTTITQDRYDSFVKLHEELEAEQKKWQNK